MAKVVESARLKDIEQVLQRWPEYSVIGNKPYAKGCFLIKKACITATGEYQLPKVVLVMDKNYDMLELVSTHGFHPEQAQAHVSRNQQKGLLDGDIMMSEAIIDQIDDKLRLLVKSVELLKEGRDLGELFLTTDARKDLHNSIDTAVFELKHVYGSVKRGFYSASM